MKVNVAIIDDGINSLAIGKNSSNVKHFEILGEAVHSISNVVAQKNMYSHGSRCAALFMLYAPTCNLFDLNVFNESDDKSISENIITALQWCLSKNIDIICMSLGSYAPLHKDRLENIVKLLNKRNIILICACNNSNRITYPASLPNTIGVRYDNSKKLLNGEYQVIKHPFDGIDIVTSIPCDSLSESFDDDSGIESLQSNSFAVPYIAAKIVWLRKEKKVSKNMVLQILARNHVRIIGDRFCFYSRNMHNFIDYSCISIPIICIDNISIINQIKDKFCSDGYLCAIIGDIKNISESEFSYYHISNEGISLSKFISIVYNVLKPNIILIYEKSNSIIRITDNIKLDAKLREGILSFDDILLETKNNTNTIYDAILERFI